jgi:hypothetical protein
MHTRRKVALAAAAFSVAFIAGCGVRPAAQGSFDRTFQVNGPVRVELAEGSGDSRITAGPAGEVRVHGEFRIKSWSREHGRERMDEIEANPPVSQDGNLIRISGPSRHSHGSENLSVDYTIVVPPDTEVHGITGSGDINVGGVRGPVNLIAGSGHIGASEIAGDVQALAGSGEIHLSDVKGRVQATAGSGEISLTGVKGETRLQAGSGRIQIAQPGDAVVASAGSGRIIVTGATSDLRLHGSSGGITVDGDPGTSSYWDLRTSSGNVELHVPASGSFRFYAKTNSGTINAGIPIVMEGTTGKHELRARIGEGKGRVEVETSSGNIALR